MEFYVHRILVVTFLVFPWVALASQIKHTEYQRVYDDVKLVYPLRILDQTSASGCAVNCGKDSDCVSFNYNKVDSVCELTDHPPHIVTSNTDGIGPNADHLTMTPALNWWIYYSDNPACYYSYTVHLASEAIQTKTSTNYPGLYNNYENYYWLFIKPSTHSTLHLDFVTMDVETHSLCNFDRITIYSGACTDSNVIANLCGSTPQTITDSWGNYVLLHFKSDVLLRGTGFLMNFYIT